MSQLSPRWLAVVGGLGHATDNAGERGRDLATLKWLGEQLTDAGGERVLGQTWSSTRGCGGTLHSSYTQRGIRSIWTSRP